MGSTPILAKAHVLKEALQRLGSPKHERMHFPKQLNRGNCGINNIHTTILYPLCPLKLNTNQSELAAQPTWLTGDIAQW